MSNSQLILLLIIIVVLYLLFKKADPYQDFKKWLDRHPQQKHKLGQELCDEIFIRPAGQASFAYCWEIAVNQTPIPQDSLLGNKLLIPIIREYLREQKGVIVKN